MFFDIDGLVDLHDLEQVRGRVQNPGGENGISLEEPFTDDFMRRNTDFDSLDAFFERSPWQVEDEADRDAIPIDGGQAADWESSRLGRLRNFRRAVWLAILITNHFRTTDEHTRFEY